MIRNNKMNLRHTSLLMSLLIFASAALATPPPKPEVSDIAASLLSIKIDGMQDLPISGLKMVKAGAQTVFISSNGRFAFYGGKLMDVWTQQEIKDLPDIDKIANRINLSRMKLNVDDLGPVTVGHGKESVLVFIDPRCPYCARAGGVGGAGGGVHQAAGEDPGATVVVALLGALQQQHFQAGGGVAHHHQGGGQTWACGAHAFSASGPRRAR